MTSSDSVSKIISCCFSCFVFAIIFAVCIPKKKIPVFLFLAFILRASKLSRTLPVLPFFESFEHLPKGSWPPFLCAQRDGYPIFLQNFSVGIIHKWNRQPHILPFTFISFIIRIQSFKRIPSLNALNERCSMNDMPSICILFAPNSTDLVLPS